jgi:hypothetical protein
MLIVLLAAATAVPLGAQQTASTPAAVGTVSAPALPLRVGGYELSSTRINADPVLGVWYRYDVRRMPVDIMVQPTRHPNRRTESADEVIQSAVRSHKSARRTAPGANFEVTQDSPSTITLEGREFPGHVVVTRVRTGGAEWLDMLHVYVFDTHYVRVYTTARAQPDAEAAVAGFAQDVLPAVVSAWGL